MPLDFESGDFDAMNLENAQVPPPLIPEDPNIAMLRNLMEQTLAGPLNGINTQLAGVVTSQANIVNEVQAFNTRVAAVETSIKSILGNINNLSTEMAAVLQRVNKLEKAQTGPLSPLHEEFVLSDSDGASAPRPPKAPRTARSESPRAAASPANGKRRSQSTERRAEPVAPVTPTPVQASGPVDLTKTPDPVTIPVKISGFDGFFERKVLLEKFLPIFETILPDPQTRPTEFGFGKRYDNYFFIKFHDAKRVADFVRLCNAHNCILNPSFQEKRLYVGKMKFGRNRVFELFTGKASRCLHENSTVLELPDPKICWSSGAIYMQPNTKEIAYLKISQDPDENGKYTPRIEAVSKDYPHFDKLKALVLASLPK